MQQLMPKQPKKNTHKKHKNKKYPVEIEKFNFFLYFLRNISQTWPIVEKT